MKLGALEPLWKDGDRHSLHFGQKIDDWKRSVEALVRYTRLNCSRKNAANR
ncbi:hypothetical protein RBSWK_01537 [Rhodopirellula baltica SWK14]|uniref:Uncharacterized protein n=1 Tax=Rhodopirellula baltica SWK14 TaxID=993516 RepID=L7CLP6_RHOBT|nr:hypothetical protein RBSWK_01537 [Rhodopirellula baltica SWK14]